MIIGAHVSIAGGYETALRQTKELGGNAMQIFTASPRSWQSPPPVDLTRFNQQVKKQKIKKIFVHAKYLINLASDNPETETKSIRSLIEDLKLAKKINAEGVIFHPHLGRNNLLTRNILAVLKSSPRQTSLILENSAQTQLEDLVVFFQSLNQSCLKLCLDTAHLFEAGLNLNSPTERKKMIKTINQIGWDKIAVIHTNDSRTKLGSKHDVHENIGQGELGPEPFKFLVNHPLIKKLPFILETPAGKGSKDLSNQKENLSRIKAYASQT